MERVEDETGISGTGIVLEGIVFSDGTCVTRWTTENSPGRSTNVWDNLGSFIAIHVAPHPSNKTILRFSDGEVYEHTATTTQKPVRKPRKRRTPPVPKVVEEKGPDQGGVQQDGEVGSPIPQPEGKEA